MKKALFVLGLSLLLSSTSGCGLFRGIEQWKCDRLGWCHFGTQPRLPAAGHPGCNTPGAPCGQMQPW
jgi:hypothetical protein